ncbi:MAG: hypothetical protein HY934_03855 [Candidatus Firestonebacteria bacterium]|nr:hypothetical protein [Candidatus Firestonebacteria bacterium]
MNKFIFLIFFCLSIVSVKHMVFANTDSTFIKSEENNSINIKSDNVEYVFKKEQEIGIFTGNVYMEQKGLKFFGDKVNLFTNEGKVVGDGNLKIITEDKDWTFTITGGKGEFHKNEQYAIMIENPKLVIIDKIQNNREIIITGKKMELFLNENQVLVTKDVHILQNQVEAWSDKAVFYMKEKKLVMTENAKIAQKKNIFAAENIIFFVEDNRLIMKNNVTGTVIQEKENEKMEIK